MTKTRKSNSVKNEPATGHGRRAELARIYGIYKTWKSTPPLMRGQDPEVIKRLGIDDKEMADVMQLRSQGEFAEKYGVAQETLSDWNKLLLKDDDVIDARKWFQRLTKNVVSALYRKALTEADAPRAKLWFEYIEGWHESLGIELSGEFQHILTTERKKKLDEILARAKKPT